MEYGSNHLKPSDMWKDIKPRIGEMLVAINDIETRYGKAVDEAYQSGYEDGKGDSSDEDAYQRGLNDAWKCARKINCLPSSGGIENYVLGKIFGHTSNPIIMEKFSASEAIEKIRQYEQENEEIHLGDEVTFLPNNAKGIVTECHVPDVYSDNDKYAVWCGGTMECVLKQHLTKTGRTFPEIAEVLAKMKETDNG